MNINRSITELIEYALKTNLIEKEDVCYSVNRIIEILNINEYEYQEPVKTDIAEILADFCDYAVENNIIEDSILYKDLFDTKIMGAVTPRPSEVISKFGSLYKENPQKATDYFYDFSRNTNYIRRDRIAKDRKWTAQTKYGTLDITINLSKPEKDPKSIAAEKNAVQSGYPKCALCKENEGYAGRENAAARQNHRIIPITINDSPWGMQYSPYVYYNEHCIVFNHQHTPMKIEKNTFIKLFDFVKLFPHYFLGSNADLPIVGGSILSHDHFQGGHYTFAMAKAPIEKEFKFKGFDDVSAGIVKWPLSVIRLSGQNTSSIIELADKILTKWRGYSDPDAFVFAETDGVTHNTITPIARKNGDNYELDLVLRNNITTEEHPMGVYHPHKELHNIKKENIGLIEVMGLAVLPARLNKELTLLADAILENRDISNDEILAKHSEWAKEIISKHNNINKDNVNKIIECEVGIVFEKVLECAGVYKCTEEGRRSFEKFILSI